MVPFLQRTFRGIASWPRHLRTRWSAYAATLSAGVLVFLSYPNFDLFPLTFVALVPTLAVVEQTESKGAAFGWGWLTGLVANLGGFYWITNLLQDFGYMPLWIAVPLYVLLCAQQAVVFGLAMLLGRWARRHAGWSPVVVYPLAMVAAEWLVPLIFPWYLGNSQYLNYAFIQSAELGGPLLLTGLLVACNAAVLELWRWRRSGHAGRPLAAIVALALVLANVAYGAVRIPMVDQRTAEAPTLKIGLVEADIGIYEKGERESLHDNLLLHQNLSARLAEQGAELIVWPETAYQARRYAYSTGEHADAASARDDLRLNGMLSRDVTWVPPSLAPLVESEQHDIVLDRGWPDRVAPQRGFDTPLLIGSLFWRQRTPEQLALAPPVGQGPRPYDLFNSAMLLSEQGRVLGVVDKVILMPFSEQVPYGRWAWETFGLNLYDMIPAAGDFQTGEAPGILSLPVDDGGVYDIGMMICYEDIMPEIGRQLNASRPHVLINITNDAWFGKTSEPYLHMALSIFRAVEQRTFLIRSTNTGVSCFVDPVGRIVAQTSIYDAETLAYDTPMVRASRTPYMVLGDWPAYLALGALALAGLLGRRRARRAAQSGSSRTT